MPIQSLTELMPLGARAQAGYRWHMHDGGYMFGGYSGPGIVIHVLVWLLLLAAIAGLALFLVRALRGPKSSGGGEEGSKPLDVLDERYARGEIDRDEYLQRKADILDR